MTRLIKQDRMAFIIYLTHLNLKTNMKETAKERNYA